MFIVEKSDVGRTVDSTAVARRRRNLYDRSVPSDIEEPGAVRILISWQGRLDIVMPLN